MITYFVWGNDIVNRYTGLSFLDHTTEADGYAARCTINGVDTKGAWKMSLFDAYKDLRDKLIEGNDLVLPYISTAQMNALPGGAGDLIGIQFFNVTTRKVVYYDGDEWV